MTDGKKASITIRTDSKGISQKKLKNESFMRNMLNTLANKLYYAAYADGEDHLKGTVQIAEGLTSQSVSREEDIHFTKGGSGYVEGFNQKQTDFTTALTWDMTKDVDYVNANVLREKNKAAFTEDTSITVNDEAAIQAKGGDFVRINAKQNNFNLKAAGIQGKGIEVTGAGTEFDLNNPGDVEIDASTGIVTDGQGADFEFDGYNSNITLHHAKTGILATNKSSISIKNQLGTTTINNENTDDSAFVGVQTQNGDLL